MIRTYWSNKYVDCKYSNSKTTNCPNKVICYIHPSFGYTSHCFYFICLEWDNHSSDILHYHKSGIFEYLFQLYMLDSDRRTVSNRRMFLKQASKSDVTIKRDFKLQPMLCPSNRSLACLFDVQFFAFLIDIRVLT